MPSYFVWIFMNLLHILEQLLATLGVTSSKTGIKMLSHLDKTL